MQVQKFYQSFDLGIVKSLTWQTSSTIKLFQSSLQNAKTKDKVILKHQKYLSEPDLKLPLRQRADIGIPACLSCLHLGL